MGKSSGKRRVLFPCIWEKTAGSELGESGSAKRIVSDGELVVR